MPVPTQLSDLNATAASNSPAATDTISTTDDYLRAHASILARISAGTDALVSPSITTANVTSLNVSGDVVLTGAGKGITFEGTTADANETLLVAGEPTADRTITLPDATTTLVGTDATQTLTNKTLTSPAINGTVTTTGLTLPALTLSGNVGSSGNPSLNIGTGALTAGSGTFSGNLLAANSGGILISRDTTAFSNDATGGELFLQGLDSTSANANLVRMKALALNSQHSHLAISVKSSGVDTQIVDITRTGLSLGSLALTAGSGTFSGASAITMNGVNLNQQVTFNNSSGWTSYIKYNTAGGVGLDIYDVTNSATRASFSSTGLSVTGTVSATGVNPVNVLGGQLIAESSSAYATGNVSGISFRANDSSAAQSTYASIRMRTTGDNQGALDFVTRNGAGDFDTRMTLDASGNLLVGTTGAIAVAGVGGTHSFKTTTANKWAGVFETTDASTPWGIAVNYSGGAPNNTTRDYIYCYDTVQRFSVQSNGGVANYSANNVNLSDRREKTNFAPAKSYLDVICQIPVQTFNYIDQNMEEDPDLTLGVVAQDVQAVAPELVMESNWGTEEDPKMRLSIYQTDLQYALMKALQELKAEFDAYKAAHP